MPPSIPAVIYAGLAGVSTGALFAASVVPALLMAVGLCLVVFLWVRRMPNLERTEFSWDRVWVTGRRVIAPLGAPVIILGGILGGFVTPTEAAAVGALYMLLLGFAYRTLKVRDLPKVLVEAALTTGSIMLIVASANLLGYIFARERIPQDISESMLGLTSNPTVFLLLVFALSMVLGTALDAIAVLTLTVPILLPIALQYDVDPIALGVLMILSQMIGLLTPPVGTVIFVLQAIAKARMAEVFWGSLPFLVPLTLLCFGDHLLAGRDPLPAREAGAVTGAASRRSWLSGLIGHGVGPSLTPELHEREAERQGLRYVYKVIDQPDGAVDRERLERLLGGAIELGFDGLNVTHPVKQAMVPLVDEVGPEVAAIGALNTVLIRDGRTVGHNTDVTGFRRSFVDTLPDADREPGRARRCRRRRHGGRPRPRGPRRGPAPRRRPRPRAGLEAGGVAASTSARRWSSCRRPRTASRRRWPAPPAWSTRARWGWSRTRGRRCRRELLRPDLWVADIVYRPLATALLGSARAAGCTVLSGAGMAVHQAADAFELITGRVADRAAMLRDFDELVAAESAAAPAHTSNPNDPTSGTTGERNR